MKVVIMAGGKGSRISSVNSDVPKPMINLLGKPVLLYQIEFFEKSGFKEFIIVTGHLGHIIHSYFGDGSRFGVGIKYYHEESPLGTAGALKYIKNMLNGDFLLVNGDILFDFDIDKLINFHKKNEAIATIVTHPNSHPYDSSLIFTDIFSNKVVKWLVKEDDRSIFFGNRVNSGIHLISNKIWSVLDSIGKEKIDLDRDVLRKVVEIGGLYAYDTPEYIHDMGTPERYMQVCKDMQKEIHIKKNLKNKQKAIFLDRDGTINIYKGFISNYEEIELIEGVSEAIKKINSSEYLAIIITNQPVLARGECSVEELDKIHNKLKFLLGLDGAYIDDIFYCPHHPDSGFEGEVKELKIKCSCRKPDNGLILDAVKKYNIDLKNSYMIGDSLTDVDAGKKSGCLSYMISKDKIGNIETFENINECIDYILE